jgi:energy-coupling factor transport system permease protein
MEQDAILAATQKSGVNFDPRTKLVLLITMATFVLGGAGNSNSFTGDMLRIVSISLCVLPFVLLLFAKKYKNALFYIVLYSVMTVAFYRFGGKTTGLPNFLLLATAGIITRFLPGLMLGAYVVSTTTVSEFTAAMQRMRVSEKITIPLSVMFRFFPTVADEFKSINAAMGMRGVSLGGNNKAKMIEYRLIPLMVCSAKIGEELSVAALTRGLGGNAKRTNVCKIGFHAQDWLALALCVFPFVCLILNMIGVA